MGAGGGLPLGGDKSKPQGDGLRDFQAEANLSFQGVDIGKNWDRGYTLIPHSTGIIYIYVYICICTYFRG